MQCNIQNQQLYSINVTSERYEHSVDIISTTCRPKVHTSMPPCVVLHNLDSEHVKFSSVKALLAARYAGFIQSCFASR